MQELVVVPLEVDDLLVAVEAGLHAHRREKRRQLEVLVLRPAFERVVVALGADHPHAEKQLRGRLHSQFWIVIDAIEIGGRGLVGAADRREQFTHEFVVGLVVGDGVADPLAECPHALLAKVLAIGLQQVAPFERPVVHISRAAQQLVDQPPPLGAGRVWILDECACLLGRRWNARQV